MWLKIALIVSVLLQFATAIISISLIKRTKTNIAWWLISFGFFLMALRRLFELFQVFEKDYMLSSLTNSWLGIVISVVMLISLAFIKHIFNIQDKIDRIKKDNETRVYAAIIRTEEKQKYKFAKELHDGLGPLLSSIKMAVSAVVQKTEHTNHSKILLNTEKLIDESIRTIKEISNSLSPHVLINFGLYKAVKSFINRIENEICFNINSNIREKRYTPTIEAVCYRVICELITNTLKHAEASNIYIDINEIDNNLNIKYSDDGVGVDLLNSKFINKGLGITNIQSRIKSVSGSCNFYSQPNEGFVSDIVIKINDL